MGDHLEYRCGGVHCVRCKKTYYYREHRPAEDEEAAVLKCPRCDQVLVEVAVDTFMDGSDELLHVLDLLDQEFGESRLD